MTVLLAIGGLALLHGVGFALRAAVPWLSRLMLPVSLVGGFVGLVAGPEALDVVPDDVMGIWTALPAILINVVFATLFLGAPLPPFMAVTRTGGPLIRFSIVNAVGQYVLGFGLTALVLTPVFGVPAAFGCLIEVGFSGGHGTASAMASVFRDIGFPAGGVLGQMSATIGIVTGVVGGIGLIQWGVRRGHARALGGEGAVLPTDLSGWIPPGARQPVAMGTISPVALEPFTLHVGVTVVGVLVGWALHRAIGRLHPTLESLPVFPLAMIGGFLLQLVADRTGAAQWLDRATFQRISGLALDLLVTAAVASMRLDLFVQNVVPFAVLMVAGIVWCVGSFMWMAPRMLGRDWFEEGLTAYGTLTGVAAVGLMLLRVADPHQKTGAARAFAARSLVVSPLLGGGLVTAAMPLLVTRFGIVQMLLASVVVMAVAWLWPAPRASRQPGSVRG